MTFRAADVLALDVKFKTEIRIGPHRIPADEPTESGGADTGPEPHDFLLAALGSCTSMTLRVYAERKGWPLTGVHVHLTQERPQPQAPGPHKFHRTIELEGPLDEEQRARLLDIANKCPVYRTLTGGIAIDSALGKAASP